MYILFIFEKNIIIKISNNSNYDVNWNYKIKHFPILFLLWIPFKIDKEKRSNWTWTWLKSYRLRTRILHESYLNLTCLDQYTIGDTTLLLGLHMEGMTLVKNKKK